MVGIAEMLLSKEEIKKMFHISFNLTDGRSVPLLPAYDDFGKLHFWVIHDGELLEMPMSSMLEGVYFAKKKIDANDIYLKFYDFLHQKASYPGITSKFNILKNDTLNLDASLLKFQIYHELRNTYEVRRFVITELEYIFSVCRSIYDIFQELIKTIWDSIKFKDEAIKKKKLKDSFARMCLYDEKIRSKDEIISTYGLTENIAAFYAAEAPFFKILRKVRNDFEHAGLTVEEIYILEEGFYLNTNFKLFKDFDIWNKDIFINDGRFASLKSIIEYVSVQSITSMNRFVDALIKDIGFPADMAAGYKVFLKTTTPPDKTGLGSLL